MEEELSVFDTVPNPEIEMCYGRAIDLSNGNTGKREINCLNNSVCLTEGNYITLEEVIIKKT